LQQIRIDFSRSRRAPKWVVPALFALALAFAADVALSFARTVGDLAATEKKLARLDHASFRPARKAAPEELAAARETMQKLSTPWDRLFAALETAAIDQVALLSIEPDPKAGTVTISGDSKDYLAALSYVLNLERADVLTHVQLARHEVRQNDPQRPIAFSVSAGWVKR